MNKAAYHAIDVGKLICAVLIVMIHVPIWHVNTYFEFALYNCLTRIAVPFFFTASGFFLYKKILEGTERKTVIRKYIIRILRLYITWSLIYLPLTIWGMLDDWDGIVHELAVYVRNFILCGTYTQLWYLPATIWATIMIAILLYFKRNVKQILGIGLFLYLIGLLAQSWFGIIVPLREVSPSIWNSLQLFGKIIGTTRNGLFEGLFFMSMGMYLVKYDISVEMGLVRCLFVISMFMLFVEVLCLEYFHFAREHDMYFNLIFVMYFGFYLLRDIQLTDYWFYTYLRKLSALIFYLHVGVREIIIMIFSYIGIAIETPGVLFTCVLAVTIILAVMLIQLSEKRMHILKQLYC